MSRVNGSRSPENGVVRKLGKDELKGCFAGSGGKRYRNNARDGFAGRGEIEL